MPFNFDTSVRRGPALVSLFNELDLKDEDSADCHQLLTADPTPDLKFGFYLLRLYAKAEMNERARLLGEDFDKIRAYLWLTKELEARQIGIHLHTYETDRKIARELPDIYNQLKEHFCLFGEATLPPHVEGVLGHEITKFRTAPEAEVPTPQTEEELLASGDAEILLHDGPLKLVQIHTLAGARFCGQETAWCTAYTHTREHFDRLAARGTLVTLFIGNDAEKYQFHFQNGELKDRANKDATFEQICSSCEELKTSDLALRQRLASALAKVALEDGKKRSYYPYADLWGSVLPENLEKQAIELAAFFADHHRNNTSDVEFSFPSYVEDLSPASQVAGMQVVMLMATHPDPWVRRVVGERLPNHIKKLTAESREIAYSIFDVLKTDPNPAVADTQLYNPVPRRPVPGAENVEAATNSGLR